MGSTVLRPYVDDDERLRVPGGWTAREKEIALLVFHATIDKMMAEVEKQRQAATKEEDVRLAYLDHHLQRYIVEGRSPVDIEENA